MLAENEVSLKDDTPVLITLETLEKVESSFPEDRQLEEIHPMDSIESELNTTEVKSVEQDFDLLEFLTNLMNRILGK